MGYGSTGLRNINLHSSNSIMGSKDAHIMPNQQMAQMVAPAMGVVAEMPQPVVNPNQYHLKDNLGNYAFGYSTQNSEMAEEGNAQSKKGHFANIMADGKLRRVDYIADNQGFHILIDTADNTGKYIKREAETSVDPDLVRTRMTSYMDSSSLRNVDNMHKLGNNQMGRDMSSSMMRRNNNKLNSNLYRANNLMGHDMSTFNMMGNDMSSMNNMGRDMSSINMLGHDMLSMNMMGRDMSSRNNIIGQGMVNNMMGHDMSSMNVMDREMLSRNNMMGQGMVNNMMDNDRYSMNTMGHGMSTSQMGQEMSSNLMGRDMYSNKMVSSNMMGHDMSRMTPLNRMSQRMQIETMPSQSLNRFF